MIASTDEAGDISITSIKTGKRLGAIAPMQGVVSALELDDMIAVAAYVASQEP